MARAHDYDPERHKFVVTVDYGYYPDVTYCTTRDEAEAVAERLIADDGENSPNAYSQRPAVIIAEILTGHLLAERDEAGERVGGAE